MHISGYMDVSWTDYRMKWSTDDWRVDSMRIRDYGHLWMPDIYSQRFACTVLCAVFDVATSH